MTKDYYTSYVQHMIRYYNRTNGIKPESFRTEADRLNWEAVDSVVTHPEGRITAKVIDIGMTISDGFGFVKDKVAAYCEANDESVDTVWQALRDFERKIAQVRGLI